MATTPSIMKGFYRLKKNKSGITKPTSSKKSSLNLVPSLGSDITQLTALISHGSPDLKDYHDNHEELMRQFDMNMAYGPCLGMSRLARWERAQRLGLNPPTGFEGLLKAEKVRSECWWDSRILKSMLRCNIGSQVWRQAVLF